MTTKKNAGLRWLGHSGSWLLLLLILGVAAIMIVIPGLGGAVAYTVLTGSMEPGMPPGSLAVIKPVHVDDVKPGDVITYQLKSGEPSVVTHRVLGIATSTGGERRFVLRGDANNVNDAPIRPEQIRGRLWYQVPLLGHINSALTGTQRQWLSQTAVAGLLGYAAFMCVSALREKYGRARSQ